MTFWNKIRIFKLFIQLIVNPKRTELIFKGVEIASKDPHQEIVKAVEQTAMAHASFAEMYRGGYAPPAPAMETLKAAPEGSFGREVYNHMNGNGLDFSIWPRYEADRPIQYLSTRIYQDHDLWHALLGYGVSVEDELAIQAFGVAQFHSPVGLLLVAGGIIHLLMKSPARALEAFRKINEGYFLGRRAHFLLSIRLQELFARPLSEARELCGIKFQN